MQRRGAYVEVLAANGRQHLEADDIDHKAADGDPEHQTAQHGRGLAQAMPGFHHNPDSDDKQGQSVHKRGQHRYAVESIGAACVSRTSKKTDCNPGQNQRGRIGQHVTGVSKQGQ